MGIAYNTSVVRDGLMLYYDLSNTKKSWKGAPATNASLLNGQDDVSPWSGDGAPTSLGIDQIIKFRGKKVAKFQTGTSGNCYINGSGHLSIATTSTAWTTTIYLKKVDETPISSVGGYLYVTNNTNVNATATLTQVEDGWYKAVYTRSGLTSGYPTLTGLYGLAAGTQYYFAEWQCENNSFSSPYVDGTRSNAQAVLDLTNKNTISITGSPAYSDLNITFPNSNSSYLELSSPELFRMGNQNFTICAWLKQLDNGVNVILEARGDSLIGYLLATNYPAAGQISMNINYNSGQSVYGSSITSLPFGAPQNIVAVVDRTNSQIRFYLNGSLWNTVSGLHSNTISPTSGDMYRVGFDKGNSTQNYELYSYMHYSRALSSEEVKQNFEAARDRYGI